MDYGKTVSDEDLKAFIEDTKERLEISMIVTESLENYLKWLIDNVEGDYLDKRLLLEEIKERRKWENNLKNICT